MPLHRRNSALLGLVRSTWALPGSTTRRKPSGPGARTTAGTRASGVYIIDSLITEDSIQKVLTRCPHQLCICLFNTVTR